jgi:endonuclease YncB( thermonuclease family)
MNARSRKRLIRAIVSILVGLLVLFLQQKGWLGPDTKEIGNTIKNATPGLYAVDKFEDGDTIRVYMEGKTETIRLIGVDTPETQDPRKPVQCFGKAASAHTKEIIGLNRVRLEADTTNSNRDRYGRLLRYVYLPDGTLVNKKIVADGFGFVTTGFPFTKMEDFKTAENNARQGNLGLWGSCQIDESKGYNQTNPSQ